MICNPLSSVLPDLDLLLVPSGNPRGDHPVSASQRRTDFRLKTALAKRFGLSNRSEPVSSTLLERHHGDRPMYGMLHHSANRLDSGNADKVGNNLCKSRLVFTDLIRRAAPCRKLCSPAQRTTCPQQRPTSLETMRANMQYRPWLEWLAAMLKGSY